MRRRPRLDDNHREIVLALIKAGASVQTVACIGSGCPDLLVGFRGRNYLLEIKDLDKPPSRRRLTGNERDWQAEWRGQAATVGTVGEALSAIGFLLVKG